MKKRIISTEIQTEDKKTERTLRPQTFADYIGQQKLRDCLAVSIEAAKQRNEPLDHLLFYGPPGLGKTTIAGIIANEMGTEIRTTSGPAIERPGEIASILSALKEGDILFVDEIHRLNKQVEEVLYPAMEDYAIDILIGKGPESKSIRLELPKFTLIGATTRAGLLSAPLRDRFGEVHRMEFYKPDELAQIIHNNAKKLDVGIDADAAMELAKRSRGTPRLSNRLLKRTRDYAQVRGNGVIDRETVNAALNILQVDALGLDVVDKNILLTIINKFCGGPVGLDTLAAATGEDAGTIEDLVEPYLLQCGLLQRTPRGRIVTEETYRHFGIPVIPQA